ncbi:hypothetical protein HH310_42520 [Actinoplanes sp. TBRC 11911]|uniref:hypothetical protein n=1 Tax=Actinoplanes sp. TBRC 11911 TaxID=2729386 RepID=UPI00145F5798|nr:hypothetical protein [Actinoplanes sp. TBRC 11911]NMO57826.1 hypothetical protein [Actinoplanes sp. TBRC 11911]
MAGALSRMLGGLVQAGAKALGGERFSLVSLLPTTLLVTYVAFLGTSGVYSGEKVDLDSLAQTVGKNAGWAILAVFGVFVISVLLRPLQITLVWILEGYWENTPVLKWAEPFAIERHLRRRHTAEVQADQYLDNVRDDPRLQSIVSDRRRLRAHVIRTSRAEQRVGQYPEDRPDGDIRLMPTMLGNALRKGEDDAGDRYGLDFPVIAPRLYPHLSDKINAEIIRNLDVVESGAALTTVFFFAAVASVPLVWRADEWSFAAPAALLLAVLAHLGTLRTARDHGLLLASAVDLHRFDMIAKLHYKLPSTPHEEWDFNRSLSIFYASESGEAREFMLSHRYVHDLGLPPGPAAQPVLPDGASNDSDGSAVQAE